MKSLLNLEPFLRKALPYLKSEYFTDSRAEQIIFEEIEKYTTKYNNPPPMDALEIAISNRSNVFESDIKDIEATLNSFRVVEPEPDHDWLNTETEKFCQEKALYNAIHDSILIMDGKGTVDKGAIPDLLTKALSVSFDPNVGHDYLEDADNRFEFYHHKAKRYPFNLRYFDMITNGGLEAKTLNIILAGTNVGKSLMMCHMAAAWLEQHLNVLYITMEMAEEKISQRIDANLLDTNINQLQDLTKEMYDKKMASLKKRVKGKLIVKEYPTASASTTHFRSLLNELWLKKQFRPHIIIVDYINICQSSRVKVGNNVNSYTLIKSVAEELRGLAVEFNLPVLSATQTTRSGYTNSDPDMTDTSESWGLPQTADEMWAATSSEELAKLGHLAIKRLKSRSGDVNQNKKFIIGVDYGKMKLYDIEDSDQTLINDGYQQVVPPKSRDKDYSKFKNVQSTLEESINSSSVVSMAMKDILAETRDTPFFEDEINPK